MEALIWSKASGSRPSRRGHHVPSIIRLAHVVGPEEQGNLPDLRPCVTHDDWMFGMLSRYSRAIACVLRYSWAPAGATSAIAVCSGWKRQTDERREAARLVLQLPQTFQRLDAFRQRLDMANIMVQVERPPSSCQTRALPAIRR